MYGEETYTSETYAEETTYTETTPPLDTTTVTETYAEEQVTEYTGEEVTPGSEEKDPQKLFLNFKTRYMNPDNPFDVLSMQVPGITEENQRKYEKTIYGYLFGPADYVTPADSWEEVARLSVIESKVHYSYSQNLGYFNTLYYMLSFLYTTVSFKESISELPKQFNILKNVKSAADLVKNSETIFRFTSNLAEIYGTLRDVDSQKADEFGFPEVDKKVMFVIGAVSSGGWSVLADISNEIFASTAQNSINYEIEKAALSSAMAFHCQRLHEIALRRDKITAEEIKEFFFHVRRFIDLKKLDNSLNIRDSMYIWQDNPDLVTSLLDFIDVIDARAAMEEDINMYNGLISNYKQAENLLRTDMSNLGVIWEK